MLREDSFKTRDDTNLLFDLSIIDLWINAQGVVIKDIHGCVLIQTIEKVHQVRQAKRSHILIDYLLKLVILDENVIYQLRCPKSFVPLSEVVLNAHEVLHSNYGQISYLEVLE